MNDIYMIMYPTDRINSRGCESLQAAYTLDALEASKAIREGRRVFKLNQLTELKEVKVSFEEIPLELT